MATMVTKPENQLRAHSALRKTQMCKLCSNKFIISEEDTNFYEKVSPLFQNKKFLVPPPQLCPLCRQQRRFAFRNERKLYHRKCDLTGKAIISNYGPHTKRVIYEPQVWWSDLWDAKTYGQTFDFARSFFEQFNELQKKVPQCGLMVWNSENSAYCNYVGHVKNSYLIFGSVYSESCYYGSPYYSNDCVDTLVVRECEHCYECIDCRKLYECFYCQDCNTSNNLIYCFDLQGCKDCIGCAGLRNKQYYIFNKQVSAEEFAKFKATLNLCDTQSRHKLSQELEKLKLQIPHRYMQSRNVEDVTGNYVFDSKNVLDSYYADRSQDSRYCAQVVDLKDCYDNNYTEENELCCDYLGAYQNYRTSFSFFCNKAVDCYYCDNCITSKNLFGCCGMRNGEYCILNKQYTKDEYEELVPRIIDHMKKTGEWGEFFPIKNSPFCYNESVAQEYFPLQKEEVLRLGGAWKEDDAINSYQGPKVLIPALIQDVTDEITKQILSCETCGKNYKIVEPELKFYRRMRLAVPHSCPDCRHKARLALRNPRQLWDRKCGNCGVAIRTSYAPDRSEKVYCDNCYLKEVY